MSSEAAAPDPDASAASVPLSSAAAASPADVPSATAPALAPADPAPEPSNELEAGPAATTATDIFGLGAANGTLAELPEAGPAAALEQAPDPDAMDGVMADTGTAEGAMASNGEEATEWPEGGGHEMKRVKVYELIGNRWIDQGTAFCAGHIEEASNEALLVARAESDYKQIVLSTTIRPNDVYQRQQDTLIVWTEPDGVDYALSFQDPEGCGDIWSFICEVQSHIRAGDEQIGVDSSSPLALGEPSITTAAIIRSGHLPQPQMGIIGEIEKAIRALARTPQLKERVCEYIQQEEYIKGLIDTMHQAEDLESLENLHALCTCMQTILTLNDHSLFEHILDDELFLGVVGMLEYDPEFPLYKANYREFLSQTARFHQPVAIRDEAVNKKIHATYRLQFLKDVVLARSIDDSTFNVLSSCIIFNQIDIINHVQSDATFLREVVGLFLDENTLRGGGMKPKTPARDTREGAPAVAVEGVAGLAPNGVPLSVDSVEDVHRREVVLLVQQLCNMGKNVQLPARIALFRTLVDRGILFAVQWALALPERAAEGRRMIGVAGEILAALLDHALDAVRTHVMRQVDAWSKDREKDGAKKAGGSMTVQLLPVVDRPETVLYVMCRIMAQSRDLAVQSQIGDSLKVLLETPPADAEMHPVTTVKMLTRQKDNPDTERFMDYFYKQGIETLFKPFEDIPEFRMHTEPVLHLSREKTNLYLYLCDLLCNFALQHSHWSHFFILSSKISVRIATLLSARDKHLRLAALRFFRILLKINNRQTLTHIIKSDVLQPILELSVAESRRDNLLSASCQELFEHVRRENMKDIIQYCMTRQEEKVRLLASSHLGGGRFTAFIRRWEMNNEPPPKEEAKSDKPLDARWGQGRAVDAEEEDYFNGDDDDEDTPPGIATNANGSLRLIGLGQTPPIANALKRKRARAAGMPVRNMRTPTPTPQPAPAGLTRAGALPSLVDYGDEDESSPGPNEASPAALPSPSPSPPPTGSPRIPTLALAPESTPAADMPPEQTPSPNASPMRSLRPLGVDADEEDLLQTLVSRTSSGAGAPTSAAGGLVKAPGTVGPIRLGEKRRRVDEDEDEGMLERLSKAKRASLGGGEKDGSPAPTSAPVSVTKDASPPSADPNAPAAQVPSTGKTVNAGLKAKDEGLKKIKLRFSTGGLGTKAAAAAAAAGAPASDLGTKDADTG